MPVIRKLVAVVMADVVGYSRLMERDEAGTHQRLRALHDELIAPKIAEHGGRTVKTSGDGMLLEFPSATSALRCAVELQREMGARNLYVAPDARIEFRIGINLGDIIVEGSEIIGDGVNVAARLESLAEPGGISVASAVFEQAGGVDTALFLWCHVKVHLARYGEAIADCERAVASDNDYWIYLDLTAAYAETGDMTRAAAARAELMKRVPDFTLSRFDAKRFSTHPVWIEEIRTRFIPGLRKAGVPE